VEAKYVYERKEEAKQRKAKEKEGNVNVMSQVAALGVW